MRKSCRTLSETAETAINRWKHRNRTKNIRFLKSLPIFRQQPVFDKMSKFPLPNSFFVQPKCARVTINVSCCRFSYYFSSSPLSFLPSPWSWSILFKPILPFRRSILALSNRIFRIRHLALSRLTNSRCTYNFRFFSKNLFRVRYAASRRTAVSTVVYGTERF